MTGGANKTFSTIFSESSYNAEQYVRFSNRQAQHNRSTQAPSKGHRAMSETPIHFDFIQQRLPRWLPGTSPPEATFQSAARRSIPTSWSCSRCRWRGPKATN